MTIIVWDGSSLAVDSGATDGFTIWEQEKVWKHGDELITGFGNTNAVLALRKWYLSGADENQFPRMGDRRGELIVVTIKNGLLRYEDSPHPLEHGFNKCAFGAGKDFAYGALAMGATAEQAAIIATKYSVYCGHGVKVFNLGESK